MTTETNRPDTEVHMTIEYVRPAILHLENGKFGFRLWLWTSYIFLIIAIGIVTGLEILLSTDQQAALVSIGISQQAEAILVQVVASITIIVALAALVVGPISGWFAGGISKFTRWSILYSPAKNVAVFGLFLTLIAFMLQLVEPLASLSLSHTTFHDIMLNSSSTPVDTLAWSPDGNYIASGSINGYVRVWNAITTANTTTYSYIPVASFKIDSPPRAHFFLTFLAWSPDDADLVLGTSNTNADEGTLQIWNAMTGTVSFNKLYHYGIFAVAWSPDGKSIAAVGEDNTVRVWKANNGQEIITYKPPSKLGDVFRGISNSIDSISWSPDSTQIASSSEDGTVQVWDAFTGDNKTTYRGHIINDVPYAVLRVAWSPTRLLAIALPPQVLTRRFGCGK